MRMLALLPALFSSAPIFAQPVEDTPRTPGRPAAQGANGLPVTIGVAPVVSPA